MLEASGAPGFGGGGADCNLRGLHRRLESKRAVDEVQVVVDSLGDTGNSELQVPLERSEADLVDTDTRAHIG